MAAKPDHRRWTAARQLTPCVICHTPAILRSPRGRPCHWTSALAWVSEHQDHEHGRRAA